MPEVISLIIKIKNSALNLKLKSMPGRSAMIRKITNCAESMTNLLGVHSFLVVFLVNS